MDVDDLRFFTEKTNERIDDYGKHVRDKLDAIDTKLVYIIWLLIGLLLLVANR